MKKEYPIVMLPTDKESSMYLFKNKLFKGCSNLGIDSIPKHLYILSDEEIKGGDWVIVDEILSQVKFKEFDETLTYPKVLASTDSSLKLKCSNCNGIGDVSPSMDQDVDCGICNGRGYKLLPSISGSFIKEFIKAYNEGKKIETVELEIIDERHYLDDTLRPKLNPDGSVIASLKEENSKEFQKDN